MSLKFSGSYHLNFCVMEILSQTITDIITVLNGSDSKHYQNTQSIIDIIDAASEIFENEPSFIQATGNYMVIGDIHGNVDILLRIFSKNGYPDESKYIFLGDYVDRGSNSVEVIAILFAFKILYPENIYLIRGNHESRSLTSFYGFKNECELHFNLDLYDHAMDAFDNLPMGAILNNEVLCLHGGIPRNINSREELFAIEKTDGEPNPGPVTDILWSDPSNDEEMNGKCVRGAGCIYGHDQVCDFLKKLNLSLICRSHEECQEGFNFPFEDQILITIFSSANYCDSKNYASIMKFQDSDLSKAQLDLFKPFAKKNYVIPKFSLKHVSELTSMDQSSPESVECNPSEVVELLA